LNKSLILISHSVGVFLNGGVFQAYAEGVGLEEQSSLASFYLCLAIVVVIKDIVFCCRSE